MTINICIKRAVLPNLKFHLKSGSTPGTWLPGMVVISKSKMVSWCEKFTKMCCHDTILCQKRNNTGFIC